MGKKWGGEGRGLGGGQGHSFRWSGQGRKLRQLWAPSQFLPNLEGPGGNSSCSENEGPAQNPQEPKRCTLFWHPFFFSHNSFIVVKYTKYKIYNFNHF